MQEEPAGQKLLLPCRCYDFGIVILSNLLSAELAR